jgi:hypothetical protein
LLGELASPLINIAAFTTNRDPSAAVVAAEEAFDLYRQGGNPGQAWNAMANQATALTNLGRWDELDALGGRPFLQEAEAPAPEEALFQSHLAYIALARNEPLDRPTLERLAAFFQEGQLESVDDLLFLACAAALRREEGDRAGTVSACQQLVASAFKHIELEDDFPTMWSRAVQWTVDVGDSTAARELLRYVEDAPRARLNPMLKAELPRLRATIDAADPDSTVGPEEIERDLLDAIAALDNLKLVPDGAQTRAVLGRWLTGQGRHAEAQLHLVAARDTFTDLRATAWLRELEGASALSAAG